MTDYEAELTIGHDIHALAEAVTTCIEAVALLGQNELRPAMLQALNNQTNILDAMARRYAAPDGPS